MVAGLLFWVLLCSVARVDSVVVCPATNIYVRAMFLCYVKGAATNNAIRDVIELFRLQSLLKPYTDGSTLLTATYICEVLHVR